jgi:hypothetical protein
MSGILMQGVNHVLLVFIDQGAIAERGVHSVVSGSEWAVLAAESSPYYRRSPGRINLFSGFCQQLPSQPKLPRLGDDRSAVDMRPFGD